MLGWEHKTKYNPEGMRMKNLRWVIAWPQCQKCALPSDEKQRKHYNSLHITTKRLGGRPCAQVVPKVYLRTGDTSAAATKPETAKGLQFDHQHDHHVCLPKSFKHRYDIICVNSCQHMSLSPGWADFAWCCCFQFPARLHTLAVCALDCQTHSHGNIPAQDWKAKNDSSVCRQSNLMSALWPLGQAELLCAAQPHIALGPQKGHSTHMDSRYKLYPWGSNGITASPPPYCCVIPKLPFAMRLDASSLPERECFVS